MALCNLLSERFEITLVAAFVFIRILLLHIDGVQHFTALVRVPMRFSFMAYETRFPDTGRFLAHTLVLLRFRLLDKVVNVCIRSQYGNYRSLNGFKRDHSFILFFFLEVVDKSKPLCLLECSMWKMWVEWKTWFWMTPLKWLFFLLEAAFWGNIFF